MDLTTSYEQAVPAAVRARYELRETRNAAAILAATNPTAFTEVIDVLAGFELTAPDITEAGGSESRVPKRLDLAFRELGWREGRPVGAASLAAPRRSACRAGERATYDAGIIDRAVVITRSFPAIRAMPAVPHCEGPSKS